MRTRQQRVHWSEQGFTLMEVMVVTAIVGIMSAIAIPNYLSWKPGYEFRGAVSKISSDLNKAKMRALEIRRECRVLFCGNAYQIIDGDQTMNSDWSMVDSNSCLTAVKQATLEGAGRSVKNISLANYNKVTVTSNNPIIFSPRGFLQGLGVTVTVKHLSSNESVGITIIQTGRVRVKWEE